MNEKANELLAQLIERALKGVDAAVQFSQQQIPDVIHQLIVWNAVSSILFQMLGIILFLAAFFIGTVARRARAEGKEWTAHDGKPNDKFFISSWLYDVCMYPLPLACFIIGSCLIAANFDWLKIWLAPKLYLLEYATSLVK